MIASEIARLGMKLRQERDIEIARAVRTRTLKFVYPIGPPRPGWCNGVPPVSALKLVFLVVGKGVSGGDVDGPFVWLFIGKDRCCYCCCL